MSGSSVGFLVYRCIGHADINNCHVTGSSLIGSVGGLIYISAVTLDIDSCTTDIYLDDGYSLSGIIYLFSGTGTVSNCHTSISGNLSGSFGGISQSCSGVDFSNCTANIDISVLSGTGNCGGFIGNSYNISAINCTSSGTCTFFNGASMNTFGGFVAYTFSPSGKEIVKCHSNINLLMDSPLSLISGIVYLGGFAGYMQQPVIDCSSSGDIDLKVQSSSNIGGFSATLNDDITRCNSSVNISISNESPNIILNVSGFVAYLGNYDLEFIGTSYSTGNININGPAQNVGGFFGYCYLTSIENCFCIGDVIIEGSNNISNVGGFSGSFFGTINKCFSKGNTVGSGAIGGFIGYCSSSDISSCFCTGDVTSNEFVPNPSGIRLGGLIGYLSSGNIYDCYSFSKVVNTFECNNRYIGGLLGSVSPGTIVERCYSKGRVYQDIPSPTYTYLPAEIGGLIGFYGLPYPTPYVIECYWDVETSGQATSAGGEGKTTVEMQQQSTYVTWDFVTIWKIRE